MRILLPVERQCYYEPSVYGVVPETFAIFTWMFIVDGRNRNRTGGAGKKEAAIFRRGAWSHRGPRHLKWRLPILRVSNYAFFQAASRAVNSACIKFQKSQVWDIASGRSAGARWVPAGGMRLSLIGALRRSVQRSRAACGRTRPALCTPGSPPWASGQLRRTRRGHGVEPLPLWWRRGPSDGSGTTSAQPPISWARQSTRRAPI
ncbi:hypothetical protein NDU88_001929 [Pleurodeles waltl]|uniref:Uncharacterized protein n=1 Tax=Pleurodeles waltl TaxID=8319 RepID=A0AAV7U7T8_PLEWA|nr:hypothetical protein NDU88_001929 [Pleurodeles waltl]